MFRQSPSTELVLIKELPENICTLHVKGPNAQKVRVFVLQKIHLAIFGQLMTTAGWGPSHTVERGLCRVTWVSKLFVVGHLPNSARSIHNNLLDFLCAYHCGKSYRWVHGKVCKATLDGDEGEGANDRQWWRTKFQLVEAKYFFENSCFEMTMFHHITSYTN